MLLTEMVQYITENIVGEIPKQEYILTGMEDALKNEVRFKASTTAIDTIFKNIYKSDDLDELNRCLEDSFEIYKKYGIGGDRKIDEEEAKGRFLKSISIPISQALRDLTLKAVDTGMSTADFDKDDTPVKSIQKKQCAIVLTVVLLIVLVAGAIVDSAALAVSKANQSDYLIVLIILAALAVVVAILGWKCVKSAEKGVDLEIENIRKEILNELPLEVLERFRHSNFDSLMNTGLDPFEGLMKEKKDQMSYEINLALKSENIRSAFGTIGQPDISRDVLQVIIDYLFPRDAAQSLKQEIEDAMDSYERNYNDHESAQGNAIERQSIEVRYWTISAADESDEAPDTNQANEDEPDGSEHRYEKVTTYAIETSGETE